MDVTLADRLRAALAPAHDVVERTPFAVAMAGGRLSRAEYAAGLGPLARLHAALEAALSPNRDSPVVAAVYDPVRMTRSPLLAADLAVLGGSPPVGPERPREGADTGAVPSAAAVIDALSQRLSEWGRATPWALVGPLYVVEGSRMGSMLLARSLSAGFGVKPEPGVGLDYHVAGMATRPADWQRFKAAVNALPLTPAEADDVVAAATATMDALVAMYAALPAPDPVPA